MKTKKKILLTSFPFESNFGGGEKVALILAKNYRNKGIETEFWGSCKVFSSEFKALNFPVFKAFYVRDLTSLKSLLLSPLYITSLLIQSLFFLPYFRIKGIENIIMLSIIEQMFLTIPAKMIGFNVFWWSNLPVRNSLIKNPFFPIWKYSSKQIKLIVPTNAMKKDFQRIGVANILVIPNVVEFHSTQIDERIKTKNFRNDLNKKAGELNIGMLCRLSPEKGIFDFLNLAKEFSEHNFFIAGKGVLQEEIETVIRDKNISNVQLLGFIEPENVGEYLSTLDIFCVFSEYESFGIVAAEASYIGIPVIASNVGGLPEVVLDEKTGLIFEYGNFDEIKKCFLKLAENPKIREKMGKEGRQFVRENFLPKHLIGKIDEILFE